MATTTSPPKQNAIRAICESMLGSFILVEGVHATEKCLVRKLGMHFLVDLHIEVHGELSVSEGHRIAHEVKDHLFLHMPAIREVLIHVEPTP